ncbi:28062_t:CDS:2, partial [Gigaspora margarita]
ALNALTNSCDDLYQYTILPNQWITLKKIANFLEPFKDLIVKMSSSNSTASWIIPLFNIILNHIEDTSSDAIIKNKSVLLVSAAKAAREKLVKYYSKTNATNMLCTALDPWRKFHYFIKKEFPNFKINEAKTLMRNLFKNEYISSNNDILLSTSSNNTLRLSTRSMLDKDFDEDIENLDDLDPYIAEKPVNKEVDILGWWKVNQTNFPRLARMVRDYLAIPVSSVVSERAFFARPLKGKFANNLQ